MGEKERKDRDREQGRTVERKAHSAHHRPLLLGSCSEHRSLAGIFLSLKQKELATLWSLPV